MSKAIDNSLLGLCSAVKARSLTCGYEPQQLPHPLRRLLHLSDQALTSQLPPAWLLQAIHKDISQMNPIDDNPFHQKVVTDAVRRYRQGVGVSALRLNNLKNEYADNLARINDALPSGLISKSCEVEQYLLHKSLSPKLRQSWPRNDEGHYLLSNEVLRSVDTPVADLILEAKHNHKLNIVNYLSVDEDGRHRSWANPFGTITGRERPKGGSFVFWPNEVQSIIEPSPSHVVIKIDFDQQEPAIISALSGSKVLIEAYQQGDLYEYLYDSGPWLNLSRKQFKILIIAYLYGIQNVSLAKKWHVDINTVEKWRLALDIIFKRAEQWLNASARKAFGKRSISSLDWSMHITNLTKPSTVRNWPIQAAGADILRRCCLALAHQSINVIGCLHDAALIEVPIPNHIQIANKAQRIMANASAEVLSGFKLKTSIETIYWSTAPL